MLKYQCRYCGAIIEPDGKGCSCGASWGSLKTISVENKENYQWIKTTKKENNNE